MTAFILICALLVAVAVLLLVWPLLRPAATASAATPRAKIAAAVVAVVLPLVASVGYFWASDWPWDQDQEQQASHSSGAPDLERMIVQLKERLAQQPDDTEGWKLLGRSAAVTGNYAASRDAFYEAYTRTQGQDPDAVVGYAESLVLVDEREIDGQAAQLFEQAIGMAPDNTRALWYGGIVAYRRGDLGLAQQRWVELQQQELPPDLKQMVAERLSELEVTKDGTTPKEPAKAVADGTVRVMVQLSPALAKQAPAGATLFLIARRGAAGPPLAAVRQTTGTWPLELTMTDANAMQPGTSLADGGPLRLVARISRSGQPSATSGDLYGEVSYDFTATSPVTLTIDRTVP